MRNALRHRESLVDLFLVFDGGKMYIGMGEHKGEFVGHGIGIDRHGYGTETEQP